MMMLNLRTCSNPYAPATAAWSGSTVLALGNLTKVLVRIPLMYVTRAISLTFFFQAEDGIRDWSVTGVQTCALPIFTLSPCHPVTASGASMARVTPSRDGFTIRGILPPDLRGADDPAKLTFWSFALEARSEERRVGKECRCRWAPDD